MNKFKLAVIFKNILPCLILLGGSVLSLNFSKAEYKSKNSQVRSAKPNNLNAKPSSDLKMEKLLSMPLETVNKNNIKLKDFGKTKVFLIVNTASKCGFTNQYEGLEALYKKYKDKGLAVIGFPSNDFGAQEPGSNNEIKEFCKLNYGVSFPLMAKGPVVGASAQPFYQELLKISDDKSEVSWNFEKFLFTKTGDTITRYKSSVKPEELDPVIAKLL